MASVKIVLAFVALAMVASLRVEAGWVRGVYVFEFDTWTETSLFNVCRKLNWDLEQLKKPIDLSDEKQVFWTGMWHLTTMTSPLTSASRVKLMGAWGNVLYKSECSSISFDDLVVIARCYPYSKGGLRTLRYALDRKIRDCMPGFVEKKIRSKSDGLVSNAIYGNVATFIDSQFIADFRKSNPEEPSLHLMERFKNNCCQAYDAISAIVNALKRNHPDSEMNLRKIFDTKKKLSKYLKTHFFRPCEKSITTFKGLTEELDRFKDLINGGIDGLVGQLNVDARDDVFRYKLCENMLEEKRYKHIVDRVFNEL